MRPPPWLIRTIAGRLESKHLAAHRDAQRLQEKLLMRLINLYRHTEIGRYIGLTDVNSPAEFRQKVPIRSAADYAPIWNRVLDDNPAGFLHPKPLSYACVSSGTSGEKKYIPCPEEQVRCYRNFTNHAFFHAFHMLDDYSLMAEHMLITAGPPIKEVRPNGLVVGFGSGVATVKSSRFGRALVRPTPDILSIADAREKVRRTIEQAYPLDIRVLTGIPLFVVPLLEELLRYAASQGRPVRCARDVWPNLRLYSYSGSPVALHERRLRELLGEGVDFYEVYSSTESPVAYQYRLGEPGLMVDLSTGYFEFQPVDAPGPRVPIHEVELGVVYDIVISAHNGALAYRLGDRVEFVSTQPYLLRFAGRDREEINLGMEKVSLGQARAALDHASHVAGVKVRQFFVCPSQPASGAATHEWHVEFEHPPTDTGAWLTSVDNHLRSASANYQITRNAMPPPQLVSLPVGTIERYVEASTMFGQGKFLNLYNSRDIAEKVAPFATHSDAPRTSNNSPQL